MWGISPKWMCKKHLLGEHVEMHMFAGTLKKGRDISGYIKKGLVDPRRIGARHDELSNEMNLRGYDHQTPILRSFSQYTEFPVDEQANLKELLLRCPECKKRYDQYRSN